MTTPKDAASVVLLRHSETPEVYLVKRAKHLAFMGGVHAFPGGQKDDCDAHLPVTGACDAEHAAMVACAARELFEETGVLIAEGAGKCSTEQLRKVRNEPFEAVLAEYGLSIDAAAFLRAGRWVTPPFAPRRFDTWFFVAEVPAGQHPEIHSGELVSGEWIEPARALYEWEQGRILLAPPTLHILRTLAAGVHNLEERLISIPEARRGSVEHIEFKHGVMLFPVKTPTVPPATHTNCYLVGKDELLVIDPASPEEAEQQRLAGLLDSLIASGAVIREILLTHFHPDHVGGVNALRNRYGVKVAAHPLSQERLGAELVVDRTIAEGERWELSGGWVLEALYTPGHTRDHIAFYEHRTRSLICGDLMAGVGTVVIDPPEGNMLEYLHSLERVGRLEVQALFPSHGPPTGGAQSRIEFYIQHRLEREQAILEALTQGIFEIHEIVKKVYTDVPEKMHQLAARSVLAHIEKLLVEGRVVQHQGRYLTGMAECRAVLP